MTRKRKPNNTYIKEFKLEAIRLMEDSGRIASAIAMEVRYQTKPTLQMERTDE